MADELIFEKTGSMFETSESGTIGCSDITVTFGYREEATWLFPNQGYVATFHVSNDSQGDTETGFGVECSCELSHSQVSDMVVVLQRWLSQVKSQSNG